MDLKTERLEEWKNGKKMPPVRIELHPTDRCNLNCKFCWQNSATNKDYSKELSEDKLLAIVDEAAEMGVKEWIISGGGEPLVRKSATLKILERIKEHGMWGQLTTNGTLLADDDVKKLVEIGWDQVQFSIDGHDAATQDYLRGASGAFEKSTAAVKLFSKWKAKLNSDKPFVGFNTVLNRLNFDKMQQMIELAHSVGSQLVYVEPIYGGYLTTERLTLNNEEIKKFQQLSGKAMETAKNLGVQTNLGHFAETFLIDKSSFEKTVIGEVASIHTENNFACAPCFQPWYLMGIKGCGLAGCCSSFEVGEYIHSKTLEEIWYGKVFEKIRGDMMKKIIPSFCEKCSVVVVMENRRIRKEFLSRKSGWQRIKILKNKLGF